MKKIIKFIYLVNEPWITVIKHTYFDILLSISFVLMVVSQAQFFLTLGVFAGDYKYFVLYIGIPILEFVIVISICVLYLIISDLLIILKDHIKYCYSKVKGHKS